jgi:hypothetical protein
MMIERYELKPIIAEFIGRAGISKASSKSVCENAETREPAERGDVDTKEQVFY